MSKQIEESFVDAVESRPYAPPRPEDATTCKNLRGTPVDIDGEAWIFADHPVPPFDVIDDFFDQNVIDREYDIHTVQRIALELLQANYELLSTEEAVDIILHASPKGLVEAVEAVIFGAKKPRKTYSDWLFSAMMANNIDYKSIHRSRWLDIVNHLVETGRAIPRERFVTSAVVMSSRARLLSHLTGQERVRDPGER